MNTSTSLRLIGAVGKQPDVPGSPRLDRDVTAASQIRRNQSPDVGDCPSRSEKDTQIWVHLPNNLRAPYLHDVSMFRCITLQGSAGNSNRKNERE